MKLFDKYFYLTLYSKISNSALSIKNQTRYTLKLWPHSKKLRKVDSNKIGKDKREIRLFAIYRNESLRLQYFIEYYKKIGVDRFIFIDNDSSDDSSQIILSYDQTHIFNTQSSYKDHWYWIEYLLNKYGNGHWCLVVDIDELLMYPGYPYVSLQELCKFLDRKKETALRSLLLDLYSKCKFSEIQYKSGENPTKYLRYFDKEYSEIVTFFRDRKSNVDFTSITYVGGVRDRVFKKNMPNHLSKISLLRFDKNTYLTQGMHAVNNATISRLHAVTLHTKFLQDFPEEVEEETIREVHFDNATVYKIFHERLRIDSIETLYSSSSLEFTDLNQLIELGMIRFTEDYISYINSRME